MCLPLLICNCANLCLFVPTLNHLWLYLPTFHYSCLLVSTHNRFCLLCLILLISIHLGLLSSVYPHYENVPICFYIIEWYWIVPPCVYLHIFVAATLIVYLFGHCASLSFIASHLFYFTSMCLIYITVPYCASFTLSCLIYLNIFNSASAIIQSKKQQQPNCTVYTPEKTLFCLQPYINVQQDPTL